MLIMMTTTTTTTISLGLIMEISGDSQIKCYVLGILAEIHEISSKT